MRKLFSLDFLNKDILDTDVYSAASRKVAAKGDEVTPELLLKLYFREIYDTPVDAAAAAAIQTPTITIPEPEPEIVETPPAPPPPPEPEPVTIEPEPDEGFDEDRFDRDHAQDVYDLSVKMGKLLGLVGDDSSMLKEAAFYHAVGKAILQEDVYKQPDGAKKAAKAGYDYLINVKKQPERVAKVALKLLEKTYDSKEFPLKRDASFEFPLHHIVEIASFYVNYYKVVENKEAVCNTMLKIGYARFNPYILHRFVYNMRISHE